jgi:multidrug efflux pump subunit AcrA (membrane-fusion protein)
VRTAQVTYQDLEKSFSTNGKVEPVDDFQVHAPAAGQVQDVYVDVGQKVKAGQLLLKMDDKYALANLATPTPPSGPPSSRSATSNTAARRMSATPPPPT